MSSFKPPSSPKLIETTQGYSETAVDKSADISLSRCEARRAIPSIAHRWNATSLFEYFLRYPTSFIYVCLCERLC